MTSWPKRIRRLTSNQEIVGSSPIGVTVFIKIICYCLTFVRNDLDLLFPSF